MALLVHDSPTIKVKLQEKVRADDEGQSREIANQLKIVIDRKDRGFSLSTNRESLPDEWRRGLETHLSVWVPKSMAVTLSNEHGQVSLDGVSGSHSIKNAHGSVTIKNVDGSLRVENRHGLVNVSAITGDCNIKNKYGAVEVEAVGGKTEIENAHGSDRSAKTQGGRQSLQPVRADRLCRFGRRIDHRWQAFGCPGSKHRWRCSGVDGLPKYRS